MANHKKTETAAKLKKFYSTITNAINLGYINYGGYQEGNNGKPYFLNYINAEKSDRTYSEITSIRDFPNFFAVSQEWILTDGTIMGFDTVDTIYFDVNGDKKPNKPGRDIFFFSLDRTVEADFPLLICTELGFDCNNNSCSYSNCPKSYSREILLEKCKTSQTTCTMLIKADGWEFKDDYPYKL